jgi:hypothetical protein
MLRHEVQDLQQQSLIMAQVLKAYTTEQAKAKKFKTQRLSLIDTPLATKWWKTIHPGGATLKDVKGTQENPIDLITAADATMDPYDPDRFDRSKICHIISNLYPRCFFMLRCWRVKTSVGSSCWWANHILTFDRHYLRAPMPHDPASSLIKTVTGDYGSPMTYKDIVNNKVCVICAHAIMK